MAPTISQFFDQMEQKGYPIFHSVARPFNVNIVGWRNSRGRVNRFDDFIAVYYQLYNRSWSYAVWPAATRPGTPWLLKPMTPKGAAILLPGHYPQAYKIGPYKGDFALLQREPVRVYRDKNHDSAWDLNSGSIEEGLFGIHIHRAGHLSKLVGNWSAGCQVFQKSKDFDLFLKICRKAAVNWGNKFTYTLLEF